MNPFAGYLKLAGLAALVVLLAGWSWFCYHEGGKSARGDLAAFQSNESAAVLKAVLAQRASGDAELVRVQGVVNAYETDKSLSPVVPGLAGRLRYYEIRQYSGPVSKAGSTPGAAPGASGVPRGDPEVERLHQAALDAAARDAARLNLCRDAWPQ